MAAHDINKCLEDVHFMAKAVKSKAIDTKDYIVFQDDLAEEAGGKKISTMSKDQLDLWAMTLETLIETLEEAKTKTGGIREKLDQTTVDTVKLKALIEGMVATAQANVDAQVANLERELEDAEANIKKHSGCFKDAGEAIKTIVTFGISCAMLDQTKKKAERARNQIRNTKEHFSNSIVPLIEKLKGMNGVAASLLKVAFEKSEVVREFEQEVSLKLDFFKKQQGRSIAIRMQ